jgi:2-alkenal reductase
MTLGVLALALAGCSGGDAAAFLEQPTPVRPAPVVQPVGTPGTAEASAVPGFQTIEPTPLPPDVIQRLTDEELLVGNVFQRVAPAVVRIESGQGLGSGFLIDATTFAGIDDPASHYIVTNNHVVAGSAGEVVAAFSGLFEVIGEVVGTDPDSDIAVVRIDELPEAVEPIALGDSERVVVGQRVIAIGNPFGQDRTVTTGIVSAVGRTIEEQQGGYAIGGAIQTDAAINPGNSGGPLLDTSGRVLGMNTAILSASGASAGIGFAVPVELIKKVVPALIEQGRYDHPWLGVRMGEISTLEADRQNLPSAGILIAPSGESSPVYEAGLRGQAILTAIDGTPVTSSEQVISYLELNTAPGETATLTIVEANGVRRELQVELGARPQVEDVEQPSEPLPFPFP